MRAAAAHLSLSFGGGLFAAAWAGICVGMYLAGCSPAKVPGMKTQPCQASEK